MDEKKFKILLVEDNSLDQLAFKRLVEREKLPYDYQIAGSVSAARGLLEGFKFDAIISDYSLGDGTALDVLPLAKETPVILVTGAGDEDTAVKAWQGGACDYLVKDVDRNYLKNISRAVENAVRQSELKKALARKQKNLEAIFDAAPICMLLVGEDMRIMRVNDGVRQMIGKEYSEIIGQLPGNALGCINSFNSTALCGGSDACKDCLLRQTVCKVFAGDNSVKKIEIQLTLKVGNTIIGPWICVSAEPVNIDGKRCAVVALDDISARKQAEGEVKRLSTFPQLNPSPILEINDSGEITYYNAVLSEIIAKLGISGDPRVFLPADMDVILAELKDGQKPHFSREVEIGNATFSELIHFVREFNSVRIYMNDITAHKNAEKKLTETMELKSRFISTVSHELRTPLTCIKEAVDAVLDGVAGRINDKQRNFLEMVHRNIDRLTMLINDVLDFQRLESGRSKIDISENDMGEVIRSVDEIMSVAAKQKDINFVIEQDGKLPKMWFDSNKIIQVMTNLVSNAIKFTPAGGTVTVSVLRHGDEVMLRVRDTGMGIPKESLPKIFERFYRVSRPGKEIQGTGLGLSIVRKIVDLHQGRIEVESELDKGATFTVFMPLDARVHREVLHEDADEAIEASFSVNSTESQ